MLPLARGLGAWYLGKDLQHNCFGARKNYMEQASFMRLRLFYHSVGREVPGVVAVLLSLANVAGLA